MTTEPPRGLSIGHTVLVAVIVGAILALAASVPDFLCQPDFKDVTGRGKGTGFIFGLMYALGQPALFFPLLAGFGALAALCARFPLLFRPGSTGRMLGAMTLVFLLLFGVLWSVLLAPDCTCEVWAGARNLGIVALASLLFMGAVFALRRGDLETRHE